MTGVPTPAELAAMVARLQALGATVTWPGVRPSTAAPAAGTIPPPAVGQIWSSPRPGILVRAILEIAPHPSWSRARIWFAVPGDPATLPRHMSPRSWQAWARRSGARPVEGG